MNRQSITITAGFATLLLFLTGCVGFSSYRDDLAIQAMAKRSYAKREGASTTGPFSKDYERGWRQAYLDISHGGTGCPPSVPPQVYWSTKYQNSQGCQHITAWYDGYRCGAAAAMAECRSSFAKVPVMANCIRPSAVECSPVEPCREPVLPEWQQFGGLSDPASTGVFESELVANSDVTAQSPIVVAAMTPTTTQPANSQQPASQQSLPVQQVLPPPPGVPTQSTDKLPQQSPASHQPSQPTAQANPFQPLSSLEVVDFTQPLPPSQKTALPNFAATDAQSTVKAARLGVSEHENKIMPISYPETVTHSTQATVRLPFAN